MPQSFTPFVKDVFHMYDNYAVILNRTKPYMLFGRSQTEEEATALDHEILTMVRESLPITHILQLDGNQDAPGRILAWLQERS
jgi:hypothetical protein